MTQPPQQPAAPGGGPYHGPPPGAPYGPPPGNPAYGYPRQPPPALSPGGAPLADFGTRLLAALIDWAIQIGVVMVVVLPIFFLVFFSRMTDVMKATDPYTGEADPSVLFGGFLLPLLLAEVGVVLFTLAV